MTTQHHLHRVKNSLMPIALNLFLLFPGQISAGQKQTVIQSIHSSGGPYSISVNFGTPNDSFIAGKPIFIVISWRNAYGLWPGPPCFNAVFRDTFDTLRKGKYTPLASFSFHDTAPAPLGSVCRECLINGIDTAKIILYSAPYAHDTFHQISFDLDTGGTVFLHMSFSPFVLLPGPLDSISIEDDNFKAISGPETLAYPNSLRYFYSVGYDHYQNLIGYIHTNWTTTSTLHPIDSPSQNISRIWYEAVDAEESGFITARTVSPSTGKVISDSVEVVNQGSRAGVRYGRSAVPKSAACALKLYNALGKLVYQKAIREPHAAHDIISGLHLKTGIYFMSLKGGAVNIVRKIPVAE